MCAIPWVNSTSSPATPRKLHRMHRAAYRWLAERHVPWSEVRFDVVAIYLDPTGLASVQRYIGVDDGAR